MDLPFEEISRLMATVVSPRPLAWISSCNPADGGVNIAPFNSYTALANSPPLVGVSFSQRDGGVKDTLANLEASGEFVLNVVTKPLAEAMNLSAHEAGRATDDFARLGLTSAPIEGADVPRIAESPAAFACKVLSIINLEPSHCRLVIAQVVGVFASDGYDPETSEVLASVGPLRYATLKDTFSMPKTWG